MRCRLEDLKPGMILAADLCEPGGRIQLPEATELTDRDPRYLQMWGVAEAEIEGDERVRAEPMALDGVRLRLAVQHSGIEIPVAQRSRICSQPVHLMGGRIEVESEEGHGGLFTVDHRCPSAPGLPVTPAQGDTNPVLSAEADGARRRVLLAEDNPVNQLVARGLLTRLGCDVDVAANGHEAIRLFAAARYDLVLMDCMMPGLDGYEATAEIRRIEPAGRRTPVVAMTANAMQGDRERCLAAGMDDYLSKPVDRETLARVLGTWAEGAPS